MKSVRKQVRGNEWDEVWDQLQLYSVSLSLMLALDNRFYNHVGSQPMGFMWEAVWGYGHRLRETWDEKRQ